MSDTGIYIGVDIGGTFTDVVAFDRRTGDLTFAKVSTTLADRSDGFVQGIDALKTDARSVRRIIHGTTAATNALLERRGAQIGMITTKGFRDVIEIRRRDRPHLFGLSGGFVPLIPRNMRLEVDERTLADGAVERPVDPDELADQARNLVEAGATVIAIAFLHSYSNPSNELAAKKILAERFTNLPIVISSEVLPEFREFERFTTTAVNAYLRPVLEGYVGNTYSKLAARGHRAQLLILQSNGGAADHRIISEHAERTLQSGPAGGVRAAAEIARHIGADELITLDMGGTSTDVALIRNYQPTLRFRKDVEYGLPVSVATLDIETVGAGGGSIASIDKSGILQVGPRSAGATPGPACYGRGGVNATVTDAQLVLGRLSAATRLGTTAQGLDLAASENAIRNDVAEPLGIDLHTAAAAIIAVANRNIASRIRLISISKGLDPRNFALFPYGGAGALHAADLLEEMGMKSVIVPLLPGMTSALGCVLTDLMHNFVAPVNTVLSSLDFDALRASMDANLAAGEKMLGEEGLQRRQIVTTHSADMSFDGQTHTIQVDLTGVASADDLRERFLVEYGALFDNVPRDWAIRVLYLRTVVSGGAVKVDLEQVAKRYCSGDGKPKGSRPVWFAGKAVEADIYQRTNLPIGARIVGPAIVEAADSTVSLPPNMDATVDRLGNLIVSRIA